MNILSKRSNKVIKKLKERGGRVQTRVEALFITMYARTKTGRKNQTYHPLILPGPPEL